MGFFAPGSNVNPPLVEVPQQDRLNQLYGGGSLFTPPVLDETLRPYNPYPAPNATGLIDEGQDGNNQDSVAGGAGPGGAGGAGDTRPGSPGADRGASVDRDAATSPGLTSGSVGDAFGLGSNTGIAAAAIGAAVPGMGLAGAFARTMSFLGIETGVINGPLAPKPNTSAFAATVGAGRSASARDMGLAGVDKPNPGTVARDVQSALGRSFTSIAQERAAATSGTTGGKADFSGHDSGRSGSGGNRAGPGGSHGGPGSSPGGTRSGGGSI